jgi:ribosomal protein S18 acetylase RimI-like enzyme
MRAKSSKQQKSKQVKTRTARPQKRVGRKKGATVKVADTISFRPRTPSDDEYIVQLTEQQLGGVHEQSFGEQFPREQFMHYIQSGAPTVLIEQAGKSVGYYSYLVGPDGKMHISAMVIDPGHQSAGVGTTVMKQLEQDAKRLGLHTMEVFVQGSNEKSLSFTRKLGFVEAYRLAPNTICFQKPVEGPKTAVPGILAPGSTVAKYPFL